ncbi:cation diffusion facilitator family transporter [Streptomyces caniferus]|uniref:cation diffusion facilitator family transporter n=1 Tax=Streptomyces caniferus TaxID=285557 RepID=UPI002E2B290B|nr:cation diffusion facilitator family transporter [Streptomyces caniferus]
MSGDHEGNAASAGNAGDAVGRTAGWQEFGRRGLSEQESGRRGLSEQEFGRTRSGKHEPGSHEAGNELGNAPGSEPGGRELGNEVPGNEELGSEEPGNEKSGKAPGGRGQDGETRKTVWVALGANLGIAVAKAVGGGIAGSPALLSEAAHSVADSLNEVFLLASLRRSERPADPSHPFGYGKERFFWSLLAAVGIFVTGGCFSFVQGIEAFQSEESESGSGYAIGLAVLVVALLAEGTSLLRALSQVRAQAKVRQHSTLREIRRNEDPALRTVLAEDSTACLGVLLAILGMALHMATGDGAYEAWASLLIGALLVYVAYVLGKSARAQLIGEAVAPEMQQRIRDFLDGRPEIDAVTAALTMRLGPDSVMLAARVDLVAGLDSEEVEEALVRTKRELRAQWPELGQLFLDVTDASVADRVRARRAREELDDAVEERRQVDAG